MNHDLRSNGGSDERNLENRPLLLFENSRGLFLTFFDPNHLVRVWIYRCAANINMIFFSSNSLFGTPKPQIKCYLSLESFYNLWI